MASVYLLPRDTHSDVEHSVVYGDNLYDMKPRHWHTRRREKHGGRRGKNSLGLVKRISVRVACMVAVFMAALSPAMASETLSTHYIFAFDRSLPISYSDAYRSLALLNKLDKLLKENGYDHSTDYISMVAYTMEAADPSIERYVLPYKFADGSLVIWAKMKGTSPLRSNFPNWPVGEPKYNLALVSTFSSLQSIAKPFALIETGGKHKSKECAVDRTLLIFITDRVVNGISNNYKDEWKDVSEMPGADTEEFNRIREAVFNTFSKINNQFNFDDNYKIKYGGRRLKNIPVTPDGGYKIVPYKVVVAEKPSIYSVTDMPSPLPLRRVRGGFRLGVTVAPRDSSKYSIREILIKEASGRETLGAADNGKFDFTIPSDKIKGGDSIMICMSLQYKDGLYDGCLVSYRNEDFRDGMVQVQQVQLQDEAKVLGLLPLSDSFWWWSGDDVFTAVMIWDVVILLILIVAIALVLYRCWLKINSYRPSDDKLKITKV